MSRSKVGGAQSELPVKGAGSVYEHEGETGKVKPV